MGIALWMQTIAGTDTTLQAFELSKQLLRCILCSQGKRSGGDMMVETPTVWIVEDDDDVRQTLVRLLSRDSWRVEAFSSPLSFFDEFRIDSSGCILIDYCLPEMDGAEVQRRLTELHAYQPVVFMSAHAGIRETSAVMRNGAIDFLEKPFSSSELLTRIEAAVELDSERREDWRRIETTRQRLAGLTPRETEVMGLVVAGLATKNIARKLNISHKTVEVHRSNITKKMCVDSVPDLVRIVTEYRLLVRPNPEHPAFAHVD